MLSISCPKTKEIIAAFDNKNIDGINFKVVNIIGLSVIVDHDSNDDEAKRVVRKELQNIPKIRNFVSSCQIIDENGQLV